eukprot:Unigene13307_Nuclearia_a/m.40320 Unigene13307_Nuclearia_a/g.40320  ORF Unigene13307_Nuclearia_a/g.40320 Unigene13307_Nuclearia_a/m.40320 type:complete len:281 (+) Unigene13307_Nuclearia_a:45-887(+)
MAADAAEAALLRDLRRKNALVVSLQQRNEQLEEAARAQHGRLREAQRAQADAQQIVDQHRATAERYRRKYHDAVRMLRDQHAAVEALQAQIRARDEQAALLRAKYARAKRHTATLLEQTQQMDAYLQQTVAKKQQLERDVQQLRQSEATQQAQTRTTSDLVSSLEATVQSLEAELHKRDRHVHALKKQLGGRATLPPPITTTAFGAGSELPSWRHRTPPATHSNGYAQHAGDSRARPDAVDIAMDDDDDDHDRHAADAAPANDGTRVNDDVHNMTIDRAD